MNYDRCEDDGFIIRGKAIPKLELMRCNSKWNEDFNKALDLAIKVLRQMGSEDSISRQQAIEAIEGVDWYHVNSKGELVHGSTSDEESWYKAEDIYKAIESLPPVTPTERTGEWIKSNKHKYECPFCHVDFGNFGLKMNYCPNCGAKMKGGTENE